VRMSLFHTHLKGLQEIFADNAFGIVAGSDIGPAFRLPVYGKVLERGNHVGRIDKWSIALESFYCRDTDSGDEIRIFPVCLFRPAPTRVARQVEHRSQALLRSAGANLGSSRGEDIVYQAGIPSRSQCNGLWIRSSLGRGVAMEALLMEQNRDSEARVFLHPLLERIREFRHLSRTTMLAGARHLTQALFQQKGGTVGKESSFLVYKHLTLVLPGVGVLPCTQQLSHFFFQGHARKQVANPLFNQQARVAVRWSFLSRRTQGDSATEGQAQAETPLAGPKGWAISHRRPRQTKCWS
jgi:hypothetical protein